MYVVLVVYELIGSILFPGIASWFRDVVDVSIRLVAAQVVREASVGKHPNKRKDQESFIIIVSSFRCKSISSKSNGT